MVGAHSNFAWTSPFLVSFRRKIFIIQWKLIPRSSYNWNSKISHQYVIRHQAPFNIQRWPIPNHTRIHSFHISWVAWTSMICYACSYSSVQYRLYSFELKPYWYFLRLFENISETVQSDIQQTDYLCDCCVSLQVRHMLDTNCTPVSFIAAHRPLSACHWWLLCWVKWKYEICPILVCVLCSGVGMWWDTTLNTGSQQSNQPQSLWVMTNIVKIWRIWRQGQGFDWIFLSLLSSL